MKLDGRRISKRPPSRSGAVGTAWLRLMPTSLCAEAIAFPLNPECAFPNSSFHGMLKHPHVRLREMLRLYRESRTLGGMLENKLFGTNLLRSLGIPTQRVIYGAFATHTLGGWPQYSREALVNAVQGVVAAAAAKGRGGPSFVMKSATDGMGNNVLLMTADRWQGERWTVDRVVSLAETMLGLPVDGPTWFTKWGVQNEHRGLILQEPAFDLNLVVCSKVALAWRLGHRITVGELANATAGGCGRVLNWPHKQKKSIVDVIAMEVKLHVAWGSIKNTDGRAHVLPGAAGHANWNPELLIGRSASELSLCRAVPQTSNPRSSFSHHGSGNQTAASTPCLLVARALQNEDTAARLEGMAKAIGRAVGASWFRLDAFLVGWPGSELTLTVNEVTFPSHNENSRVKYDPSDQKHLDWLLAFPEDFAKRRQEMGGLPEHGALLSLVEGHECRQQHAEKVIDSWSKDGRQATLDRLFGVAGAQETALQGDYATLRKPPNGYFDKMGEANPNGNWDGKTMNGVVPRKAKGKGKGRGAVK